MTQFQAVCMGVMGVISCVMALYAVYETESGAEFFTFAGFGIGYFGLAGVYA